MKTENFRNVSKQYKVITSNEGVKRRMSDRKLKVYKKFFSRSYHKFVSFPEIKLCGKWLNDLGFECGQELVLQCKKNKIIITTIGRE